MLNLNDDQRKVIKLVLLGIVFVLGFIFGKYNSIYFDEDATTGRVEFLLDNLEEIPYGDRLNYNTTLGELKWMYDLKKPDRSPMMLKILMRGICIK